MFSRCKTQPEAVSCGFIVEKYKNFYENCDVVMIIMTIKIAFTFYILVCSFYCLAYNKYTIYDNYRSEN